MRPTKQPKSSRKKEAANLVEPRRENETPKALLNDVVLQNIFKYLGFKDLKSCRDVGSVTWLRNSKKAWWARTKVVFRENDHYDLPYRMTKYLNQSEINSNATNYKFMGCRRIPESFLSSLGHSIKYLELVKCTIPTVDAFRNLVYTQCPNLEKLIVDDISLLEPGPTDIAEPPNWTSPKYGEKRKLKFYKFVGGGMRVSWMEFLSHFPNLQAIEADLYDVDIYKVISIIRQHDPKKLKLTHIDIQIKDVHDYRKSVNGVMLDPNLSLETVRLDLKNCKPKTVVKILNLHAKSLKEICIRGESLSYPRKISLSQPLQNLVILSIGFRPYNLGITKFTPHVREVVLSDNDGDYESGSLRSQTKLDACKELTFPFNKVGTDSNLNTFLNAFPNVEVLETNQMSNSSFTMICERYPKLVSFNVTQHSKVDVVGLLGFDPGAKYKTRTRNANITNLKDLRSFSLTSGTGSIMSGTPHPGCPGLLQLAWVRGTEMIYGDVIFKELESLHHLKRFKLKCYHLKGSKIWEKIFKKYWGL